MNYGVLDSKQVVCLKRDVLGIFSVTLDRWDDPASVLSYKAFPCCHEFSGRWVISSGLGFPSRGTVTFG